MRLVVVRKVWGLKCGKLCCLEVVRILGGVRTGWRGASRRLAVQWGGWLAPARKGACRGAAFAAFSKAGPESHIRHNNIVFTEILSMCRDM